MTGNGVARKSDIEITKLELQKEIEIVRKEIAQSKHQHIKFYSIKLASH